ncbi:MAG: MFS transporter [Hyphomicrobiaceae bacterium]|nr:MFS transporter [Hyphomicrobiaceae bacterium]
MWLTVILPFAMGFFVSMAFKCINAILAHPLMEELHLASVEVGWITSLFLLTFAVMQLPLGLILDHWGPRKTQALLFVVGAAGITVFGLASDVTMLAAGRAILGIGMAGGLMAAFKATADWCKTEEIPFYNGIILGVGGLGALMVTSPAKFFELEFGWRALCFAMAGLTLAVAALVFFAGRDKPGATSQAFDLRSDLAGLKTIYTDPFFWRLAPLIVICNGGFIAMLGLWLGPWLQHVVGLSPLQSAHYLFAISLAMTVGFASGGFIARLAGRLGQPLIVIVVWGVAVYIAVQILLAANIVSQNYLIWAAYGISAKAAVVGYAELTRHFGPQLTGRVVTGTNIFVSLFAFAAQYAFGVVLHLWPENGAAGPPAAAYQATFSGLIVLHLLALGWFLIAGRLPFARAGRAE